MSKQMIKILGILLSVCFLMSTTAAAWSTESKVTGMEAKEMMKEKMMGKVSEEKGLSKCNNVFIRYLVVAKNIIILKVRAHPFMHAMLFKKGMMGEEGMMGENEGMMPCEGKLARAAVAKKMSNMGENEGMMPSEGKLVRAAVAKKMSNAY